MDRDYEKKKASRKKSEEEEQDMESSKGYGDRVRDHKHRIADDRLRDLEDRHHSDKYRKEKRSSNDDNISKDRVSDSRRSKDDKHRNGDRHRSRDSRHHHRSKRERSRDSMSDGEESRDRVSDEGSGERRHSSSHKRKDRGGSEDRLDGGDKRIRFSDREKDERKQRRRFEDKFVDDFKESSGIEKEERRDKRKFEDQPRDEGLRDAIAASKEERRERRRSDGRTKEKDSRFVKEEMRDLNGSIREERRDTLNFEGGSQEEDVTVKQVYSSEKTEKPRPLDQQFDNAENAPTFSRSGSIGNGAALEPQCVASRIVPEISFAPIDPIPTKVSSISTTNENKSVSVTRSHEVPGKSSTDGSTSATSKSGNLSLDAIAKAKKALQMQKGLAEKLKKFPLLNRGARSNQDADPQMGLKDVHKTPISIGTQHEPVLTTTGSVATPTQAKSSVPSLLTTSSSSLKPPAGLATVPTIEVVQRAQELAAKMGFHQDPQFAPLINTFPGQVETDMSVQQKPVKAPVLRLDALGREIDEHGNVVNMPKLTNLSTLKVNINKQKKEAFQIIKPQLDMDPESNPHFDPRMGINKTKLLRPKRMNFQFVEEGKWSKQAEIIKFKSQFGEAQAKELRTKQAQLEKAKAELDINPNLIEVSDRVITKEKPKDPIPEVEWWDAPLLLSGTYDFKDGNMVEDKLNMKKITIYVEHPQPIEPPAEPAPPPPQPLKLTKKERKKLRTQRRLAKEKDRQEMIRQGLLEPPKPKIKMSNLMKVLGSEATQDPTRLEMEIRSAAAEREQAHVDRNIARKLTPAERSEKKERKLFDDPNTMETIVSVYKINSLSHPQTRFKVDVNAQENRLTGCAVISDSISVVVVEGGSKAIKRYGKLMLKRIDWAAAVASNEDEDDQNEDSPVNKCLLVWQGSVAKRGFSKFLVHQCRTDAAARKVFSDAGVGHYWDLAINFCDDQM